MLHWARSQRSSAMENLENMPSVKDYNTKEDSSKVKEFISTLFDPDISMISFIKQ